MCPSFRVTGNERDVTRGRANSLRLAISGQLGPGTLASDEMLETLKLCVSCKGCRRECPTGVDMAKMKIEVLAAANKRRGLSLHDRLVAYLPRYAPLASRIGFLLNLRDSIPGLARLSEPIIGMSAKRSLPKWKKRFAPKATSIGPDNGPEVVLFADTFNRYHEPENLKAALAVLTGAGYRVHLPSASPPHAERAGVRERSHPLCCGRTFLAAGLVDEARKEAERTIAALLPFAKRGVPIVGLEPSCIFTFRDEIPSLVFPPPLAGEERPKDGEGALTSDNAKLLARSTFLFEEFVAKEIDAGRFKPKLGPIGKTALLHGHCHQKAFDVMGPVQKVLKSIPDLDVQTIESSCCGMAGAFGYQRETIDVSMKMAELSLLPAVRKAPADAIIVADGTSCRHQIHDGTGRKAIHVVAVLSKSMSVAE
jgi:Fe-S oxidoreductase